MIESKKMKILKWGIVLFASFIIAGCSYLKIYPQDNVAEEIIEEIIELKTGIDLDLSPFSPE